MSPSPIFTEYAARLRDFIRRHEPGSTVAAKDETEFNALALDLFGLHYAHNPAYRALCHARKRLPLDVIHWRDIPAVPAVAFKAVEMTVLCPDERTAEFHSSGTTGDEPSRHFHCAASLAIYEASLLPWFQAHVLPEMVHGGCEFIFVALTPPPKQAPRSSLAHMFGAVQRRFAPGQEMFTGEAISDEGWRVNHKLTQQRLRAAVTSGQAVALLGTAFNFVHLLDRMADEGATLDLPAGSRVMETGGYKGRSRELPRAELHRLMTKRLGISPECIVCEYGMSELSSQAYDRAAGAARPAEFGGRSGASAERRTLSLGEHEQRRSPGTPLRSLEVTSRHFRLPPWARAQIVSPETGREVADGEMGLVRVFDLANVASALAVQTEDLAVRRGEKFELIGRLTDAEPRGCSLRSL